MFSHQFYIKGIVLSGLYPLIREPEINQSCMSMYVVERSLETKKNWIKIKKCHEMYGILKIFFSFFGHFQRKRKAFAIVYEEICEKNTCTKRYI